MRHSGSPPDAAQSLVGDASFWINLTATDRVEVLLEAFGQRTAIPKLALDELERGRAKGRMTAKVVEGLVRRGLIDIIDCHPGDEELFLNLVVGASADTLDDGEAATLVCALRFGAMAVIDERKATSLAAARFPELPVCSTIHLLLNAHVSAIIGRDEVTEAVFCALVGARMRVAPAYLEEVAALLGPSRVARCQSLPSRLRSVA